MLRHLLDHLGQVLDALAVRLNPLLLVELLQLLRHVLGDDGDVLKTKTDSEISPKNQDELIHSSLWLIKGTTGDSWASN